MGGGCHLNRAIETLIQGAGFQFEQLETGYMRGPKGTVALLASDCNVILVSDACGQLMLERTPPTGITAAARAAKRSMDTLMERVRLANFC